jgi:hypothetical protein
MGQEFKIEVEWLEGSDGDPVERATFAQIVINAGQEIATELEDIFARTVRPGLRASAYHLAMWLAENWWRLRWEPEAKTVDWRLSHVVAAAGKGVAWPDVCFTSDGVHVFIEAHRTFGNRVAPVRYLRDLGVQISAAAFEAGIDEFVERVLARLSSVNIGESDLRSLWKQLLAERRRSKLETRRRLEALLGFDPDEAPSELITALQARTNEAGQGAVDEIAAATKTNAPDTLREILERTRTSGVAMHVQSATSIVNKYLAQSSATELPWQRAALAASLVRNAWGVSEGPVPNDNLSNLLGVPESFLEYTPSHGLPIAAGFRTNDGTDAVSVIMRAKVQTGRRFEIMRLVADNIAAPLDDRLLPVTTVKTDRQKFQRAFAQEFLLPFDELCERLIKRKPSENDITEDEIDDVASEYDVSPLLVRTALVNKGALAREVLAATNWVE